MLKIHLGSVLKMQISLSRVGPGNLPCKQHVSDCDAGAGGGRSSGSPEGRPRAPARSALLLPCASGHACSWRFPVRSLGTGSVTGPPISSSQQPLECPITAPLFLKQKLRPDREVSYLPSHAHSLKVEQAFWSGQTPVASPCHLQVERQPQAPLSSHGLC